mgnify:FL=1
MTGYKPEWLEEDRQRMLNLERWYVLDGRHLKTLADGSDNPFHGVYTGLAAKGKELDGQLR